MQCGKVYPLPKKRASALPFDGFCVLCHFCSVFGKTVNPSFASILELLVSTTSDTPDLIDSKILHFPFVRFVELVVQRVNPGQNPRRRNRRVRSQRIQC